MFFCQKELRVARGQFLNILEIQEQHKDTCILHVALMRPVKMLKTRIYVNCGCLSRMTVQFVFSVEGDEEYKCLM